MRRGGFLKRKTPLRSRGKTKYRRRERDLGYMTIVRKLPCSMRDLRASFAPLLEAHACCSEDGCDHCAACVRTILKSLLQHETSCEGRVEADHAGARGVGQKAPDVTCVPMCRKHHGERTDYRGMFKGFTGPMMRAWCDWAISYTAQQVDDVRRIETAMQMTSVR